MDAATQPSTTDAGSLYLHALQALTSEIEAAIHAIAFDDLARFTESVARQEVLASCLRQSLGKDPALKQRSPAIHNAGRELQRTNLNYAALLKHSGRTIAMLSALCSSHTGRTEEARGTRSKHQTWSCEM